MKPSEVERLGSPLHAALRGMLDRPAVLVGALDDWPAMRRWSLEYLQAHAGDVVVEVDEVAGDANDRDVLRPSSAPERVPLRDLLASLIASVPSRWRLRPLPLLHTLPALVGDVDIPAWFFARPSACIDLLMWPAGARQGLHYDERHLLWAQASGQRELVLFAPDDSGCLYRYPLASPVPQYSRVDAVRPDFARFPRFEDARPIRCTLQAGDALFLPAYWWCQPSDDAAGIALRFAWQADWKAHLWQRQFRWRLASGLGRRLGLVRPAGEAAS